MSVANFCQITAAMGTFGEGAVKVAAALNTGSAGTADTSMVVALAKLLGSGGREAEQQSTDSISFEMLKKLQGCGMIALESRADVCTPPNVAGLTCPTGSSAFLKSRFLFARVRSFTHLLIISRAGHIEAPPIPGHR